MKSSKTSFLRNCISGWNVRSPVEEMGTTPLTSVFFTFAEQRKRSISVSKSIPKLWLCFFFCYFHIIH